MNELAYSTNWERNGRRFVDQKDAARKILFFPKFDPNPDVVKQQMEEAGGIDNYKGQIVYPEEYLFASFESVFDQAQTQADLALFKVSNVQNAFMSTLAIVYSGEFDSQDEKREFQDLIANKSGAKGAGSRIGIQDKSGTKKANEIFQPLTPPSIDRMYELTERLVADAIVENEFMPKSLIGMQKDGLFKTDEIEQDYVYYNARTRNDRNEMSGIFSMILEHWENPIKSDCKILEQQYIVNAPQGGTNDPTTVNDNLKNLTGKQSYQINRIARQFLKEQITYDQAKLQLQSGFGFTDTEVDLWLGIKDIDNGDNN